MQTLGQLQQLYGQSCRVVREVHDLFLVRGVDVFLGKLAYGDWIVHGLVEVAQGPMKHDGKLLRGGYGPIFGVDVAVSFRVDLCAALDHFAELAARVLVFDSPIKVLKQTYLLRGSQMGSEGRARLLVLLEEVHERAA